jgi:hypothetical protein
LIILIILDEEQKLRSSSLCSFLQPQLQRIRPGPRPFVTFHKKLIFYSELLARRPTPNLGVHPISPVATSHSIYSQLSFISGGLLLHPQPEDAASRGDKGPTRHGEPHKDL